MRGNSSIVDEGILVDTSLCKFLGDSIQLSFAMIFFMVSSVTSNLVVCSAMTFTTLTIPISACYYWELRSVTLS